MLDKGDKVIYLKKGERYNGVVKEIKWGMAYVDFKGVIKNEWIQITRLKADK